MTNQESPRYLEVLAGLRANDRIVTSSHTTFNDVDALEFTKPVPLSDSMTTEATAAR